MTQVTKGLVIEDPRTAFDVEKLMVFPVGGKNVNYLIQPFSANITGKSPGSLSINLSIANTQALVRTSHFHFYGSCTFYVYSSGAIAAGAIGINQIALSQNAFYKLLSSIQLSLGSYTTQWQNVSTTVDMIQSVRRSAECDWGIFSGDCSMQDCAVNFVDVSLSTRDIFNQWQSSTVGGYTQPSRASRIRISLNPAGVNANTAKCGIQFDIYVPVLVQPLYGGMDERQAFVRCNTINMTLNFNSNSNNFVSFRDNTKVANDFAFSALAATTSTMSQAVALASKGGAVANPVGEIEFVGAKLDWLYQTVDISDIVGGVPLQCYNTNQWVYQSQASAALTAGVNKAVQVQQFSFSSQPSLIMVAVVPDSSNTYINSASVGTWYCPPTGAIQCNYIESNVLNIPDNSAKVTYDMCLRNGMYMSFEQWSANRISTADDGFPAGVTVNPIANLTASCRLSGGFLVLKPSDLRSSRTPDTAAGTVSGYSSGLTFSATIGVDVPVNGNYQVIILACIPKILREVSFANYVEENITPAGLELHKMVDATTNVQRLLRESELYGGGFFSFIKDLGKKVARGVTKGYDFVKDHAGTIEKYAEKALPYLEQEIPFVGAPLSAATKFALDHKDAISKIARAVKNATGSGVELDGDVIGQMLGCGLDENDIKELVTKVSEDPNKYLEESEVTRSKLATDGLSRFVNLRQKLRL